MERRRVLALLASVGLGTLAGCDGNGSPSPNERSTESPGATESRTPTQQEPTPQRPAQCPVTQDLDVEWPDEITWSTVDDFVERYEETYYREVVEDYEPRSRFDSYQLSVRDVSVRDADAAGFRAEVTGSGAVYRPDLLLEVTRADGPPPIETVPLADIEDVAVREFLRAFANDSAERRQRRVSGGSDVDRLADEFNALPSNGSLESMRDTAVLYVDVDGTILELTVSITSLHGDYGWTATYYVDENVLRRTVDESVPAEEGDLLECRATD